MNPFKEGDKVIDKFNQIRIVYDVYNHDQVSLGLLEYPDTEEDFTTPISELTKITKGVNKMQLGINKINVRFFIYDEEAKDDIVEVDELDFIECKFPLTYERYTMFDNGCNQICLTKSPTF